MDLLLLDKTCYNPTLIFQFQLDFHYFHITLLLLAYFPVLHQCKSCMLSQMEHQGKSNITNIIMQLVYDVVNIDESASGKSCLTQFHCYLLCSNLGHLASAMTH